MTGAEAFGARRLVFGAFAATYDVVRPEWPSKTVTWMLGSPTTATVCRVVDLGAGTGKGTRSIAALGHEVIAVEPSGGMRDTLAMTLGSLPGMVAARICVMAGDAEDIPVESGSTDAVTVFQAWHSFDAEAAAAECARWGEGWRTAMEWSRSRGPPVATGSAGAEPSADVEPRCSTRRQKSAAPLTASSRSSSCFLRSRPPP